MSNIIKPSSEGNSVSRRQFLIGSGALAGAAALFGVTNFTPATRIGMQVAQAQELKTDVDILQFALTLEHLETRLYADVNKMGLLSDRVAGFFRDFGAHEAAHVEAIMGVLKSLNVEPVKAQASYNFPKFMTEKDVVDFFVTVEEVGAGAYLGAAPAIQNLDILAAAAAIHNVEAQHAASLKVYRGDAEPSPAFGSPLTVAQVLAAVTPLLQMGTTTPAPTGQAYSWENPAPSLDVAKNKVNAMANTATMAFFAETGHTLAGPLLTYWNANGGLRMFGYPITEAFMGKNPTDGKDYVQQYFERTRLEWHKEFAGTENEVLLGLLGAEQLNACK